MQHLRWPSIENHYREKFIADFIGQFPILPRIPFVISEKLHGSSVQVGFDPDGTRYIGTRRRWLPESEKFYNLWGILPQYDDILEPFRNIAVSRQETVRLYGELYGGRVQKGVDYGPDQKLAFFGMAIDDVLVSHFSFMNILRGLDVECPIVPIIEVISTMNALEVALSYDTNFNTRAGPDTDGNTCEGIVIRPYMAHIVDRLGRCFMVKKKNPEFMEKKAKKKEPVPENTEVARLNAEFMRYINEARLQSVFSKHGPIAEPVQIGEYIRHVIADAFSDFEKDYTEELAGLSAKERRRVQKSGKEIAEMLKEAL